MDLRSGKLYEGSHESFIEKMKNQLGHEDFVEVDIEDATRKQKEEMQVSLDDNDSKLERKLSEERANREIYNKRDYEALIAAGTKAQMEKLLENKHKEGFDSLKLMYLYDRLIEEVGELRDAVVKGRRAWEEIRKEAADVANFAHMTIYRADQENPNNIAPFPIESTVNPWESRAVVAEKMLFNLFFYARPTWAQDGKAETHYRAVREFIEEVKQRLGE